MSDKRVRKYLQVGTMECMLLCMGIALLVGIGFITIGFWKTLLLALLLLIGLFIGGVSNKREVLTDCANKMFPARAQQNARNLQLAEKVRRTVNNADFDEEPEEPAAAQAEEAAKEAEAAVSAQAEELAGQAEEAVSGAAAQAQEALETLKDQAEDTAQAVQEAAAGQAGEWKDTAEEMVQNADDELKKAADEVNEAVSDIMSGGTEEQKS